MFSSWRTDGRKACARISKSWRQLHEAAAMHKSPNNSRSRPRLVQIPRSFHGPFRRRNPWEETIRRRHNKVSTSRWLQLRAARRWVLPLDHVGITSARCRHLFIATSRLGKHSKKLWRCRMPTCPITWPEKDSRPLMLRAGSIATSPSLPARGADATPSRFGRGPFEDPVSVT